MNNRFDRPPAKHQLKITCGKQDPAPPSKYFIAQNPPFYGYCYLCGYNLHSQSICPLKKCAQCGNYGHSAKICTKPINFY